MRVVGLLVWALISVTAAAAHGAEPLIAAARTTRLAIEPARSGHLPWTVFDERSGLPQHTVVDLITDERGFVWAATQDGPARYDGRTWEAVPLPRRMGTNYPRVMRAAADGGIWFGSFDGGLAHLRDETWTITDQASGLPSNRIRGLLETEDAGGKSLLWIATESGVARLQDGQVKTFGAAQGLLSVDTEGLAEVTGTNGEPELLVGTANGLARLVGDRFEAVPVPRQILGHRIGDIVESAGLKGGPALWITSYGAGMAVLENGVWTVLDTASGLPSNVEVITKSQAEDGSPALWIGTEGGLLRFEHGRFTLYDERSGLPIRIIWKVLEEISPSGLPTIWLGTWGGGVVRLNHNAWTAFDASTGMPPGAVTSVLATQNDKGAGDDLGGHFRRRARRAWRTAAFKGSSSRRRYGTRSSSRCSKRKTRTAPARCGSALSGAAWAVSRGASGPCSTPSSCPTSGCTGSSRPGETTEAACSGSARRAEWAGWSAENGPSSARTRTSRARS